jgi:hypothetical protein
MSTPAPTEAEQLAGADALIEFGRWLAIYGKTAGICTCCAEKLIEALERTKPPTHLFGA